jgi:hypothetical protein
MIALAHGRLPERIDQQPRDQRLGDVLLLDLANPAVLTRLMVALVNDVSSQLVRLSSIDMKIAPRSVRIGVGASDLSCILHSRLEGWVVRQPHSGRASVAIRSPWDLFSSMLRTRARLGGVKANEKRHHCPFHRSEALGMPTLPIKLPGNMR